MAIVTPPVIIEPFGVNAGPSYITNPIPVASQQLVTPGAASYQDGFVPLNMTAETAGGIPPFGQDMNGILYAVTASIAALQAGQLFGYNAAVATQIGGYPLGVVLASADGSGLWFNFLANNGAVPDTAVAGLSDGWVSLFSYGKTAITLAAANHTCTQTEAAKQLIVCSGALTSNVSVILPPYIQSWRIANACTGAFTVTFKTPTGTGVVIPQGGLASPTQIYGDGTNIYFGVSPLSIPISVSPTASSILERDASGIAYAQFFNMAQASANFAIGSVFVENSSLDGTIRKQTVANFIANTGIDTVTARTTAISTAVTPLAPKASPTLTGNVGVPTRSVGDATANAASTAFVAAAIMANGGIIQTGAFNCTNGTVSVAFANPFPNGCDAVMVQWEYASPDVGHVVPGSRTTTGFQYSNGNAGLCTYIALGH